MNKSILGLAVLWLSNFGIAGELEPLIQQCDGCHGVDGVSQWTDMPTIAGISEFVHSDALLIYKDEARPCNPSTFRIGADGRAATDMCAISKSLTEAQIDELAKYYAGKLFVNADQEFDATLSEQGKAIHDRDCERCHTDGGANPDDDASVIKGQWMGYLRQTFAEYKSGEREQPDKMKAKLEPLSDEEVEALVHFYANPE